MAQIVKLRRSAISGQKPTNSNLQLGEIALNTTDGKAFMAVSGSGGPSVQEFILTNTVNTGSIHLVGAISASVISGSFIGDGSGLYNIPISGVTNLLSVSGSLDSRLDVLEAYSSSQQVPTASYSFRTSQTDVYCKNVTGAQIDKGKVVRIVGATGDNPLIELADSSSESNSANTLGITIENIPNDSFGLVITEGILIGVDTLGMTAGQLLYLGTSGSFTTTAPIAPNHGVRLGEVLRVQQNNGSIYVRIDNGMELGEAHDVIYTGLTSGDLLVRSGSVWTTGKSLSGSYSVTGSLNISGSQTIIGSQTISGSVTVLNNLTVLGTASFLTVTSSNLDITGAFISVNVYEPLQRFGGIKVFDSGSSSATASLAWDSQHNHWVYQNADGSTYTGGMLISGPRNTGSLGDEPTLTLHRVPVSDGGDHIKDSSITDNGIKVSISSSVDITGSLHVTNGITGSVDFTNLINLPTLVSGSSQINITGTTGYSTFSSSISSSISSLSSSVATTTSNIQGRLNSIEGVTGSYATTGSNNFNGGQTITGSLTVSGFIYGRDIVLRSPDATPPAVIFYNDQTNATYSISTGPLGFLNIMNGNQEVAYFGTASSLIDSRLDVSGNVYAPLFSGSFVGDGAGLYNIPASGVTGLQLDRIVDGSVSASISSTDGLRVNTDVFIDGTLTAKELHIDYVTSSVLYESGSTKFGDTLDDTHQFTGSVNITGSILLNGEPVGTGKLDSTEFYSFTSSYTTGAFTGSFKGDGAGLYNIPASGVTGLQLDRIVGGTSEAVIDDDGLQINTSVSITGSLIVDSITGSIDWSNIENAPSLVSGSSQIIYSGITGLPDVVLTSQTSSMSVLTASYAVTAAFALNAGAGGESEGRTAKLEQISPATTWNFGHNLGEKYPTVTIYDIDDNVIVPETINAVDSNNMTITFPSAVAGYAVATVGGGLPFISGSFGGYVLAVNGGAPAWKGGIISGSLQLSNLGYATTGSNTFVNDQVIDGNLFINEGQIKQVTTTSLGAGTHTIGTINSSLYDAAFFDYVIKGSTNMRAGTVMSVWDGSTIKFNETSTNDIGNTEPVTLSVTLSGGNAQLVATISSGTWNFSTLIRGI